MSTKTYVTVCAVLFLVMAIVHLLRAVFGWEVQIGVLAIPLWVSWLAILVAGALSYFGFRLRR